LNATDGFQPGSQKAELGITILQVVETAKLLEKAGICSIEVSGGIREAGEVTVRTEITSPTEEAHFREYSKGFRCKNNFTAFLGYNYCFLYHY
jgi:hypothetical protein